MRKKTPLQPYEIRALRIERNTVFDLLREIFSEVSYEKFQLPYETERAKNICIEWHFDEKQGEIFLFAYHSARRIDVDAAIAYTKNLSVESVESLLVNIRGRYYQSIKKGEFWVESSRLDRKKRHPRQYDSVLKMVFALFVKHIRPLRRHELRVIRLSEQAIRELLWEYFMKVGDDMMDIPEEESFKNIFYMSVEDKLEELKLYVVNLNEVSLIDFEKVNEYCSNNICFTTDLHSKRVTGRRCYTTVMLPKSCISK